MQRGKTSFDLKINNLSNARILRSGKIGWFLNFNGLSEKKWKKRYPERSRLKEENFYILQFSGGADFKKSFSKIVTAGSGDLPKSGGMISENTIIQLTDNTLLFGISYKGDLEGWEKNIHEYCRKKNMIYGQITDQTIFLSNNQSSLLSDCRISFY